MLALLLLTRMAIGNNGNSQSLLDIRYALQPKFTIHEVTTQLDTNVTLTRDIYGARYLPGYAGLNNVGGKSDCECHRSGIIACHTNT